MLVHMMYYSSSCIPGKLAFALKTGEQKFFEPLIKELLGHLMPLSGTSASFLLHQVTSLTFSLQCYDEIKALMSVWYTDLLCFGRKYIIFVLLYYSAHYYAPLIKYMHLFLYDYIIMI